MGAEGEREEEAQAWWKAELQLILLRNLHSKIQKCKDPEIIKSVTFGGAFYQTNPASNRIIYSIF